jgi:DNA-directed RNA polymerase subunit alpha
MQPLERGFGTTLGNALRRVLLSSLPGASITSVKVDGALHEFTTLPGVVEDLAEIILNIKSIRLRFDGEGPRTMRLAVEGPGAITAESIQCDESIEILNPDLHLLTLADDGKLEMDLRVDHGRGYVQAKENRLPTDPIGVIPIDSIFSPVTRVNFIVEAARVAHRTDYDRLIIEVWTDGSLSPSDSLVEGAKVLIEYFALATTVGRHEDFDGERDDIKRRRMKELLKRPVSELELSVRSSNCLRQANIKTLADLVQKSEQDMLKYQNFGRKSLSEISEMLEEIGLSFGMDIAPYLGEDEGVTVET